VRAKRAGAVAAALVALGLGACGGGDGGHDTGDRKQGGGGEEAEREAAAKKVPAEDRVAYYQLATTAGILRTEAALAQRGRSVTGTSGDGALRAGRARLALLQPRDATLARLGLPLGSAIDAFLRASRGAARRAAARPALAASSAVDTGLRRYLVRHQAQGALVPD
jgi:hypothetical protein